MASIEDTARQLDTQIGALLNARDHLYMAQRNADILTPAPRAKLLAKVEDESRAAARIILALDISGATDSPATTTEEHGHEHV